MQNQRDDSKGVAVLQARNSPLRLPVFRSLYLSNAVSNFGGQIQAVAAAWLMASLTSSPQLIALVQAAISAPVVLLSLAGGSLADNLDRRRIMLVCHLFMILSASLLVTIALSGAITPFLLLALVFLISAGRALNNPAWHASVREVVSRQLLGRAVALNSTSINLARTCGPAIGGAIVALFGVVAAFIVNALSLVVMAIAVARWRPIAVKTAGPRESLSAAMFTGMRYAIRSSYVRNAMLHGVIAGFSASAVVALLPVLARHELDGGAVLFGLLLGAYGVGAVSGAMIGGLLRERYTIGTVTRTAILAIAIGLFILGMASAPWIAATGSAVAGLGWVMSHSSLNTSVQLSSPGWVVGRALALYTTATFAAVVSGNIVFGAVAQYSGVFGAYVAAGSVLTAGAFLLVPFRLPVVESLNMDPLERWQVPQASTAIRLQDGPVLVERDYRVLSSHREQFLKAMADCRRIRRRDGARSWELRQSLHDQTLWTESYRVPTWAEYLRHNQRLTHDDVKSDDAAKPFRADEKEAPGLRHYLLRSVRTRGTGS